jgi:hypothetical protein
MDKHVDESWKESAEKEKHTGEPGKNGKGPKGPPVPEVNFATLISGMAMEALIFMGEFPNPATGKKEHNLDQARYAIDMLAVIKEKTKGNLSADEANALDNMLYELRTKFVQKGK